MDISDANSTPQPLKTVWVQFADAFFLFVASVYYKLMQINAFMYATYFYFNLA